MHPENGILYIILPPETSTLQATCYKMGRDKQRNSHGGRHRLNTSSLPAHSNGGSATYFTFFDETTAPGTPRPSDPSASVGRKHRQMAKDRELWIHRCLAEKEIQSGPRRRSGRSSARWLGHVVGPKEVGECQTAGGARPRRECQRERICCGTA